MAYIINIETSTEVCSVALSHNEEVMSIIENHDGKSHASHLSSYIDQVLEESKIKYSDLSAIAVGKGPGSYTGLRIGVSTAKGMAYGLNIPLISVCSLKTMASFAFNSSTNLIEDKVLLCPMMDARRMEVFTTLYDNHLNQIKDISAEIILEDSFQEELASHKILFFGNGAEKCKVSIQHPNAHFINGIFPSAKYMTKLSFRLYEEKVFENLAYFEPFYLKDFIAIKAKNPFQKL